MSEDRTTDTKKEKNDAKTQHATNVEFKSGT